MMNNAACKEYSFRACVSADEITQAIYLIAEMQGVDPQVAKAYFSWKYKQNPNSKNPIVFLAFHEGRAVGFRGFFPLIFSVCTTNMLYDIRVLIMSDAFVIQQHQRKGLLSRLTLFASQELSDEKTFFLTTSSNYKSTGGYLKMGWYTLMDKYLLDRYHLLPTLQVLFGKKSDETIPSVCLDDAKSIASLYSKIESHGMLKMVCFPKTNRQQIEWRFSNPITRYFAFPFYKNGDLVSFVVACFSVRGIWILDYQENVDADKSIFSDTIQSFCEQFSNYPRIRFFNYSLSQERINYAGRLGFHPYQRLLDPIRKLPAQVPLLIQPTKTNFHETDWLVGDADLRNSCSWSIPGWCNDGV